MIEALLVEYTIVEDSLATSGRECKILTLGVGVPSPGQSPDLARLWSEACQWGPLVAKAMRALDAMVW